jgi:hypothetical protein
MLSHGLKPFFLSGCRTELIIKEENNLGKFISTSSAQYIKKAFISLEQVGDSFKMTVSARVLCSSGCFSRNVNGLLY